MNRTPSTTSELTRFESFQYPNTHLGHLTDAQQTALTDFKQICQKEGYFEPPGVNGRTIATHDDATLLRYLRARKFSPTEALVQFRDTENWRKENQLVELYDTIDVTEYEETRKLYPQWTGRRDKRGIPLYLFKVSHLDSKTVSKYEKMIAKSSTVALGSKKASPKMLNLFTLYENLTRFVLPLCTALTDRPNQETPVTQSNNIVDISGVGLKQFWNLKAHMQDASTLATAYYPETLDRIFIIGAPSFFPTVWGWIKRWFDPITVSKIFILSNASMKATLEQYIDPENIPRKYGGTLDFDFGDMPDLDPAILDTFRWSNAAEQKGKTTIPKGPIKWYDKGDTMEMIAVGSVEKQPRKQVVATTHADLHGMTGIERVTSHELTKGVRNLGLQRTTTTDGTSTQPKEGGDLYYGSELANATDSGTVTPEQPVEAAPDVPRQSTTKATNDVDSVNPGPTVAAAAPIAEPSQTIQPLEAGSSGKTGEQPRVGTSDTRFAQQEDTHAAGKLEQGTPAVVDHGHGDRTATMEPSTVGQAPKESSVQPVEIPQPTLYERAQAAAGAVYATGVTVAEKVGVVKSQEQIDAEKEEENRLKREAEEQHKRDIDDPNVNKVSDEQVEDFLRRDLGSRPAKAE